MERRRMMDGPRFDDLLRSLTGCRRALLGGALAVAVSRLGVRDVDAKRRRKRKKKHKYNKPKAKPNAFGCLDAGRQCDGNDAGCCSGICEGSGTLSRCVGHNELGCDADDDTCSESVPCGTAGVCHRSTGKAGFYGNPGTCRCAPCQKDTDCQFDFGPGAACVICTGDCAGVNRSQGTAGVPAAE
jgi:hypothetical protein